MIRIAVASRAAVVIVAGLLAIACKKPTGGAPPPPEVVIVVATPRQVSEPADFMGTLEASRSVAVRSQVTGVIIERPYTEGGVVEMGDVLFRIDTTTYAAAYRSAQARLADVQARAANAERNLARLRPLLADNAVARRDVDDAEAESQRARAAVDEARGAMDRARKDYDEATVRAPLHGRVGRAAFVVGSRVTGPNDLLTTIEAVDPVYVTFRPSAQQQLAWKRDARMARLMTPGGGARVQVTLTDGSVLARTGRIDFVDPVADPETGTQAFRATFTNVDHTLVPGQFVRVRLLGLVRDSAITVPQRAVQETLGRPFVWIVLPGDSVAQREVVTGTLFDGQILIESGLHAGDRVIVDGVQKIGPGRPVRPVVAASDSAAGGARP